MGPLATIRIDADACPAIYKVAARHGVVANAYIRLLQDPLIEGVATGSAADTADDWIAQRAGANDIVITADIPLASRCVEAGAHVIVGGLTRPASFLAQMVSARPQLRTGLDGVAIHPYGADPSVVLGKVRAARATLDSLRLQAVPLYVTEFGWTTHPAGALNFAPEARRPGYIYATVTGLGHTDCGIAATIMYTWVTQERNPGDHESWYGISPPGGCTSSDVAAFASALRAATAPGQRVSRCSAT